MSYLTAWHDLYVMIGGAAAALIGLLFVAASLHLRVLSMPRLAHVRALAGHALTSYLVLLFLSGCLLIPVQNSTSLAIEIAALGVALGIWLAFLVRIAAKAGDVSGPRRSDWLRTFVVSGLTAVALLAAGAATWLGADALPWLPLISGVLLLTAVFTSWDLLLRIPDASV